MLRVVICDDHKVFGEAMASVLEGNGYEVVACTDDPPSGMAAVARYRPELYLVDLHFEGSEGGEGINGIDAVRSASPGTRVVVVSGSCDPAAAARVKDAGADGFVGKDGRLEDVLSAIARVAVGEPVFDEPAPTVASRRQPKGRRGEVRAGSLTAREREILDRLLQGQDTAALAKELGVTYATARTHIQRLLAKLGARSKVEAVALVNRAREEHGLSP